MAKINILDKTGVAILIGIIKGELVTVKNTLANKVNKDGNKVLSTNDYTTTDKNKLGGIAEKAQVNVIEGVQVNGTDVGLVNKKANIDLSSYAKTSDIPTDNNVLTNGAGYQNAQQVENIVTGKGYQTASQVSTAITTAVNKLPKYTRKKVDTLPTKGEDYVIYLVPSKTNSDKNVYDEYIWLTDDKKFEFLGTTAADLSGYIKASDLVAIDETELNNMWSASTGS